MPKNQRKTKLVDLPVQGSFILQYAKHWALVLILTLVLGFVWMVLTSGPLRSAGEYFNDLWLHYAPLVVSLIILAPVIIYDSLKLSHRFVGPMSRVRNDLKRLERGEEVSPMKFRNGDFWQDFADDFNVLLDRLKEASLGHNNPSETEEPVDKTLSSTAS